MSSMKDFRTFQKMKRLKQKDKDSSIPNSCEKQFPDCPEVPNKGECKTCPFYKDDLSVKNGVTGRVIMRNPLNKAKLSDEELDDIMTEEEDEI